MKDNTTAAQVFFENLPDFLHNAPDDVIQSFKNEFFKQVIEALEANGLDGLATVIDDWSETIEIYADPETVAAINEAKASIENGECLVWTGLGSF